MNYLKMLLPYTLVLILGIFIGHLLFPKTVTKVETVEKPMVITQESTSTKDISIVNPEETGEVTRVINKGASMVAVVNGKEYTIPNATKNTSVKLGENSTLQIVESTQGKLDVSSVVNELVKSKEKNNEIKLGITIGNDIKLNTGFQHKKDELIVHWKMDSIEIPEFDSVTYMRTVSKF